MPLVAPWASGVRYWATDDPEPPAEILELLKSGGARRQNMVRDDDVHVRVRVLESIDPGVEGSCMTANTISGLTLMSWVAWAGWLTVSVHSSFMMLVLLGGLCWDHSPTC